MKYTIVLVLAVGVIGACRIAPADVIDDIQQQRALDQMAGAQQDQADSPRRMADAMERMANGGLTNQQVQQQQDQQEMTAEMQAQQAQEQARLAHIQGPGVIAEYKATLNKLNEARFDAWYTLQKKADVASLLGIQRKQNYVDSLDKKTISIEPSDDYDARLRAASKDYFMRSVLAGDDVHRGQDENLSEMKSALINGTMPIRQGDRPIKGAPENQRTFWITMQYQYPGVEVYKLWRKIVSEVVVVMPGLSEDDIRAEASKRFHAQAMDRVVVKAPPPSPANLAAVEKTKSGYVYPTQSTDSLPSAPVTGYKPNSPTIP